MLPNRKHALLLNKCEVICPQNVTDFCLNSYNHMEMGRSTAFPSGHFLQECVSSEDSDQLIHSHNLIRVFATAYFGSLATYRVGTGTITSTSSPQHQKEITHP